MVNYVNEHKLPIFTTIITTSSDHLAYHGVEFGNNACSKQEKILTDAHSDLQYDQANFITANTRWSDSADHMTYIANMSRGKTIIFVIEGLSLVAMTMSSF